MKWADNNTSFNIRSVSLQLKFKKTRQHSALLFCTQTFWIYVHIKYLSEKVNIIYLFSRHFSMVQYSCFLALKQTIGKTYCFLWAYFFYKHYKFVQVRQNGFQLGKFYYKHWQQFSFNEIHICGIAVYMCNTLELIMLYSIYKKKLNYLGHNSTVHVYVLVSCVHSGNYLHCHTVTE